MKPVDSLTLFLHGDEQRVTYHQGHLLSDRYERWFLAEHPDFHYTKMGELWDAMIPWMDTKQ